MMQLLKATAFAATVALGAVSANAATYVYCPGTAATTDREFGIAPDTGSATCLSSGLGNLSGNGGGAQPDPLLDPASSTYLGAGAVFLDKWTVDGGTSDNGILTATGSGVGPGTWIINLGSLVVDNLVLAFKSGQGQLDPDWAAFSLTQDALTGSWIIASGNQGLSHINLYGTIAPVPLPAAGGLLLAALGGLAMIRRRRSLSA